MGFFFAFALMAIPVALVWDQRGWVFSSMPPTPRREPEPVAEPIVMVKVPRKRAHK